MIQKNNTQEIIMKKIMTLFIFLVILTRMVNADWIVHSLSKSYEHCYGNVRLKILSHSYLFINSRHTQLFQAKNIRCIEPILSRQ